MPPRPFKPPRPSASSPPEPRAKSKSKANPKSKTNAGIKKSVPKRKSPPTDTRRDSGRSLGLPSLSPDSDDAPVEEEAEEIEDDDDPFASQQRAPAARKEREKPRDEEEVREHVIPQDLLNVLLHSHFKGDTRIKKDACSAIGRYMETFVREGVARCIWAGSGDAEGGGMLEVEDLEKLAPQLLMDF
ncbi:hypothetical protein HYFRA_00010222 [Hymenoscyphus fraxineus]|uniref:Centromere protein X n=1 Tax=Hymenoscyphus fraxineus TaxID=746836 RepID=A0A9N9KXU9_9HELO|nr:hypothetical protein HYFRA_00010222 [Hymenoscyphus fraxineus]